jgi:hypothetical protein
MLWQSRRATWMGGMTARVKLRDRRIIQQWAMRQTSRVFKDSTIQREIKGDSTMHQGGRCGTRRVEAPAARASCVTTTSSDYHLLRQRRERLPDLAAKRATQRWVLCN